MAEKKPIEQSVIDRVVSGIKYAVTGVTPDSWFSPNQPIKPVAQEAAHGRNFDYPVANNVKIVKRQGEGNYGATYDELRLLADTHDLTRLVIETKKDQIARQEWTIKYKDGREKDAKIEEIIARFRYPDNHMTHSQWLRVLVEDMLVIDATAIYPRKTRGGGIYSFDIVDAGTINRMIDDSGRTPMPPDTAYQQILKGVPAVNYSADEIYYSNRNRRSNKLYGFSPVEQIIITVNTALRRQTSQLDYFTSGSVPDSIMEAPAEWSPEQIKQFQEYFDAILSGQTAERRKVRFVPSGAKFTQIKQNLLKDEFDEWLAKIVCFAFSISPQALIKQMNKASAEVSVDAAEAEGLFPFLQHIKQMHDYIIEKYLGVKDAEFIWVNEVAEDSLKQAQVDEIYINSGVLTPKQVAAMRGFEFDESAKPIEQKQIAEKMEKSDPSAKMDKAIAHYVDELEKSLGKKLAEIGAKVAQSVSANTDLSKADELKGPFMEISALIEDTTIMLMSEVVGDALEEIDAYTEAAFNQANESAVQWAKERAAELVGMKYVDGELIENPNPKWSITETTRNMIRYQVEQAIAEGATKKELEQAIQDSYAFSQKRASTIANTELVTSYNQGNMEAWKASGVVKYKRSILGTNENHGEDDITNAKQGAIPINQEFQSGHQAPSYHPNCRCVVTAVLKETT